MRWLVAAVLLEALSCGSYVLMFRGIFCSRMSWRASAQIGGAELGVGSLVPASGAAGLALGAWILHRGGMPADRIARRSRLRRSCSCSPSHRSDLAATRSSALPGCAAPSPRPGAP